MDFGAVVDAIAMGLDGTTAVTGFDGLAGGSVAGTGVAQETGFGAAAVGLALAAVADFAEAV
ncbi:hypothetical protein [Thiomonas delicata]|uniref:hypothetical protein n=1 Tax=Thiomonas delicata TaxID=364030 RepID=UPI000B8EDE60|nr:hypothetical protein [Thiomonas delicata]